MASLIIQDSFEPYYAGRDDSSKRLEKPRSSVSPKRGAEDEIILPVEAPVPVIPVRRDRRAVAH